MTDALLVTINVLYVLSLMALFGAICRFIVLKNRQYALTFVLVACSFCAGEYFTRSYPQHLGTALYGVGNFILLAALTGLFGGITSRISSLLLSAPLIIIFTGYFWPSPFREYDYFLVVNAAVITVNLAIALVFALNRIRGRWIYFSVYIVLSIWMAGYAVIPQLTGEPAEIFRWWEGACKTIVTPLQFAGSYLVASGGSARD